MLGIVVGKWLQQSFGGQVLGLPQDIKARAIGSQHSCVVFVLVSHLHPLEFVWLVLDGLTTDPFVLIRCVSHNKHCAIRMACVGSRVVVVVVNLVVRFLLDNTSSCRGGCDGKIKDGFNGG